MGLLSRIFSPSAAKTAEGQYRPGPYYLPYSGGWLSEEAGQYLNFWQMGHNVSGSGTNAMVEACVSAYSQTVSMCPGDHWRTKRNGGRERVTNSDLSRIIKEPNDYQTISDFLLNLVRSLYVDGNAYALALRNNRYEVDSLHLMHPEVSYPQVYGGEIFYSLGGNEVVSQRLTGASNNQMTVPARDVLHIRLHSPHWSAGHGLKGESPLKQAIAMDLATSQAMTAQNFAFYTNQSRPSSVLTTDEKVTPEQLKMLHEAWNAQSRGMNQGKTPILTAGLKPMPLSVSAQDSQMADIMKMSDQRIALAFRIPMAILGVPGATGSAGAGTSTELLMHSWIAQGLGFALNQVEEGFGKFFGLKGQPEEYCEFSTSVLLRSSMKDRIAALAQGVQGGIYAPNEARAAEELPAVEFGEEPRVQQQVVPLSAAAAIPKLPGPGGSPPAPAPSEPDLPAADPGSKKDFDVEQQLRSRFRSAQNAVGFAA
jgi:HK97 family phage portal protein